MKLTARHLEPNASDQKCILICISYQTDGVFHICCTYAAFKTLGLCTIPGALYKSHIEHTTVKHIEHTAAIKSTVALLDPSWTQTELLAGSHCKPKA